MAQVEKQDQKVAEAQAKVDQLRREGGISDYAANASSPAALNTSDTLRELSSLRVTKEADYNQENTLLEKLKSMDREHLRNTLPMAISDSQLLTLQGELDLAQQALIKLKID